jgi:hypothetical protein
VAEPCKIDGNSEYLGNVEELQQLKGKHQMGIPPDSYPLGQTGQIFAGTTSFDPQTGGKHVRYAEVRGNSGEDVVSFAVTVIPPAGEPTVPLKDIAFGLVNGTQPQIVVGIQTSDASPIADGYLCHFTFQSKGRLSGE